MNAGGRGYTFDPLERRSVLLGLGPAQLGTLGAGALMALAAVVGLGGATGAAGAALAGGGAIAAACWPIDGRPPVAWAAVVIGWLVRRSRGPTLSAEPAGGARTRPAREASSRARPLAPPGIALVEAPSVAGEPPMGVVRDHRAGTWAAVLEVSARSFPLLDADDQRRRLAAWGALLAGLARPGSPVARVQWAERVAPADPDALLRHLADRGIAGDSDAGRAYAELIAAAGPATEDHQTLLVLAIRSRRARSEGPCTLLRREVHMVQGQLRNAELTPSAALDPIALARAVRAGNDAAARRPGRGAWPLATDEDWSALRVDGSWHATYWIAEWPRVEARPDFLAPLLLAGGRRTVSMTLAPVPSARATRDVESSRTARLADDELRRRAGFLATARRQRQEDGIVRREEELADGHAEYRFSGYVTVAGADRTALAQRCAEVEHAAQAAHLDLRRLWGQQAEAFTWTLPLARGVAS